MGDHLLMEQEHARLRRPTVQAGTRLVGEGQPVIVSAELGLNHDGDIDLLRELIWSCADVGADAVKLQYLDPDDFASKQLRYHYPGTSETEWHLFNRRRVTDGMLDIAIEAARNSGLLFHATPSGPRTLAKLAELKVDAVKLGADSSGDPALVAAAGATGLPVIASFPPNAPLPRTHPLGSRLIPLHVVRSYPCQDRDANLQAIPLLRDLYGLAGYSDHTVGIWAAVQAVTRYQACWVEVHVTLDKTRKGPDHWWSKDMRELGELVRCLR